MKGLKHFSNRGLRPLIGFAGLLVFLMLQGCSTYSSSRGYSASSYAYQPQVAYHPSHGYYSHRYYGRPYYGNYQPGWFISAGFPGSYYGDWGYAPLAYWPSYSHGYYRHSFYPYFDPWYYSYSSRYRNHYGNPYGYGYGAGYRYDNRYGIRPYYGSNQSYRPPGNSQPPANSRPDPVVIPPGQRGRRGASDDFNERVDEALRQRETHQTGRRSVTVVNEEQAMSRSIGLAPTQAGDQGMTISSRDERKVRESRLEPVGTPAIVVQPDAAQNHGLGAYSTEPVQRSATVIPVRSGRSSRGYQSPTEAVRTAPAPQNRTVLPQQQPAPVAVPQARTEPVYRQAPARAPNQPQPQPRNAQVYQQQQDSSNVTPRANRRHSRDTVRERDREDR